MLHACFRAVHFWPCAVQDIVGLIGDQSPEAKARATAKHGSQQENSSAGPLLGLPRCGDNGKLRIRQPASICQLSGLCSCRVLARVTSFIRSQATDSESSPRLVGSCSFRRLLCSGRHQGTWCCRMLTSVCDAFVQHELNMREKNSQHETVKLDQHSRLKIAQMT